MRSRRARFPDRHLALFGAWIILAGCSAPSHRYDDAARALAFTQEIVTGIDFRHAVFRNARSGDTGRIHVYLEGDGTPYVRGRYEAVDPTPRDPLALRLMAMDSGPALLVGRPCYHGFHLDAPCRAALWTGERYSDSVVASMAAVISRINRDGRQVVLIGYSGGGTMAMLLAERVAGVEAVVTIAANLDVDAWTGLHGYDPLKGSMNPAKRPPLPRSIRQLHIAGAGDTVVPPTLVRDVAARQPDAEFRVLADQDHGCCWTQVWRALLLEIDGR
jgi:hypothetical protein